MEENKNSQEFKKVFIYKDGLPDWIEQGYPVEGIEKTSVSQSNLFYFLLLKKLTQNLNNQNYHLLN